MKFPGPFLFLPSSARQFTGKSMPDDKSVGGAASVWLGIHLINQTSLVEVMYIISPINSGEYLREKYAKLRGLRPLLSMLHNTPANIRGGNKFSEWKPHLENLSTENLISFFGETFSCEFGYLGSRKNVVVCSEFRVWIGCLPDLHAEVSPYSRMNSHRCLLRGFYSFPPERDKIASRIQKRCW